MSPLCDLEGNEWEEHPKYELTGEGNSVATKGASLMYSPWHDWDSTLVTNRVMDSGIHRISLIYTVPTLQTISTMMGFEVQQLGTNFLPKPSLNHLLTLFLQLLTDILWRCSVWFPQQRSVQLQYWP